MNKKLKFQDIIYSNKKRVKLSKKIKEINIFKEALEIKKLSDATQEEIEAKQNKNIISIVELLHVNETVATVSNNEELLKIVFEKKLLVEKEIDEVLKNNKCYKKAQSPKTPNSILKYQKTNDKKLMQNVNNDIKEHGVILSSEQELLHGGLTGTNEGDVINTNQTFSTTFDPYVAISNSLHNNKAFNDNELNINIIKIKDDNINAFVFNNRTGKSHEKEVLIEKDINLKVTSKTNVCDYEVYNSKQQSKIGPVYISEVEATKK